MTNKQSSKGEIIIYKAKDKNITLEVKFEQDTIWLAQAQIAKLFQTDRSVITKHLSNIFNSRELGEKSNVQKMHIAFSDKPVKLYSLDVIISVAYRVNSKRATQFRIWATGVLREHILSGYTINQIARNLRNNLTDVEKYLWYSLRGENLGVKFRRQAVIGRYIVDFACFEKKLVIEVDGGQHAHNPQDDRRTRWLNEQGFEVLRFWDHDVLRNRDGVLQGIVEWLQSPLPNPPHKGEGNSMVMLHSERKYHYLR